MLACLDNDCRKLVVYEGTQLDLKIYSLKDGKWEIDQEMDLYDEYD